jgi:hypothetical protein
MSLSPHERATSVAPLRGNGQCPPEPRLIDRKGFALGRDGGTLNYIL